MRRRIRVITSHRLCRLAHTHLGHPIVLVNRREVRAAHTAILIEQQLRPIHAPVFIQRERLLQIGDGFVIPILLLLLDRRIQPRRRVLRIERLCPIEILRRARAIVRLTISLPEIAMKNRPLRFQRRRRLQVEQPRREIAMLDRHQPTPEERIPQRPIELDRFLKRRVRFLDPILRAQREPIRRMRLRIARSQLKPAFQRIQRLRRVPKRKLHLRQPRPRIPILRRKLRRLLRRHQRLVEPTLRLLVIRLSNPARRIPRFALREILKIHRRDQLLDRSPRRCRHPTQFHPRIIHPSHRQQNSRAIQPRRLRRRTMIQRILLQSPEQIPRAISLHRSPHARLLARRQTQRRRVQHRRIIQRPLQNILRLQHRRLPRSLPRPHLPKFPRLQSQLPLRVRQIHLPFQQRKQRPIPPHLHDQLRPPQRPVPRQRLDIYPLLRLAAENINHPAPDRNLPRLPLPARHLQAEQLQIRRLPHPQLLPLIQPHRRPTLQPRAQNIPHRQRIIILRRSHLRGRPFN